MQHPIASAMRMDIDMRGIHGEPPHGAGAAMPAQSAVLDEIGWPNEVRAPCALIDACRKAVPPESMERNRREAEMRFQRIRLPFAVYTEGGDAERPIPFELIPFDLILPVLKQADTQRLRCGREQRAKALNVFSHDVQHDRNIVRAGVVHGRLVLHNSRSRLEMAGLDQPRRIGSRIAGTDMVRTGPDDDHVLVEHGRTDGFRCRTGAPRRLAECRGGRAAGDAR